MAEALKGMTFEPLKYVVPGVIVEGLTLLAGKPKLGKSWLLLHAAIAVARGGFTLGEIRCTEGDVLYCALEDNLRRLKSRMMKLLGADQDWPKRLAFKCELPRLSEGGLDEIKTWITSAEDPRLVVIDTLAMVKTPAKLNQTQYDADYNALLELRRFANAHRVAVVVVHHLRKADADDAFDTVSGTLGLTGAPDSILVLRRDSSGAITLHGRGRDLIEIETAMQVNRETCTWTMLGDAAEVRAETGRGAVLAAMEEIGEQTTAKEIAAIARVKKHGLYDLPN
jgi:RecA-family ATPase